MARISRRIALTPEELDEMMASSWNMRIATVGPGARINLTPLWFTWLNGKIYFRGRGQKIVNLRRNANATIVVDRNEQFVELMGAMFQGTAKVLETVEDEQADPDFAAAQVAHARKYSGGHGENEAAPPRSEAPARTEAPRRTDGAARADTSRWVVFTPKQLVTWDNKKIAGLRRG